MRRFTSPEHNMIRNLDHKIELAKLTNRRLLTLLLSKQKHVASAARLELDRRRSAVQAPAPQG